MTFAEARKFVVAALSAVAAIIPQLLSSLGDVLPQSVASVLTVIAVTAGALLVYLVPNAPADPVTKVRQSVEKLGPLWSMIEARVNQEIAARLPSSPRVQAHVREPEIQPDPLPRADPFVVAPLGR